MSRLIRCDVCGKTKSVRHHYDEDYEFVLISVEANADDDHAELCGWDCLASWAMTKAMEKREADHA
jgi:hypothetical protein